MESQEIALSRGFSYRPIFKRASLSGQAVLVLLFVLFGSEGPAEADFYKYKDKNGNWVFTDSPPGDVGNVKIIENQDRRPSKSSGFRDIEKDLMEKFRPQSEVEKASLSTVTVKTTMGLGSGFFITGTGYILTNKHVLRGDENKIKKVEEFIGRVDNAIDADEATMAEEENRLRRMRSDLEDYRASIERMTDRNAQVIALQNYRSQSAQYDVYEAQLQKRKKEFEEKKWKYRQEKRDFTNKTRTARYDRQFIITLKDKTELEAYLVAVSNDQDLALLKIDECKSPYLQPGVQKRIIQGMEVFAIGSPLGVGDSVCSGVVSGLDQDYIRTDAKIYPGNSGGPLITADGQVIGINTLKLITQKFEGMGFAIPMKKALEEFNRYLKNP